MKNDSLARLAYETACRAHEKARQGMEAVSRLCVEVEAKLQRHLQPRSSFC